MKKLLTLAAFISQFIHNHATNFSTERDAIAAVIMAEGRGEGARGMYAIAEVIRNRGHDPMMQVLKRYQFSCLNHKTITQLIREMAKEPQWQLARTIATQLLRDPLSIGNRTHGAQYYDRKDRRPGWSIWMVETATLGNHRFYATR